MPWPQKLVSTWQMLISSNRLHLKHAAPFLSTGGNQLRGAVHEATQSVRSSEVEPNNENYDSLL